MQSPQKSRSRTKIILASTSPRRKEIFSRLGLPFEIVAPDYEEISDKMRTAEEEVLLFAKGKALSVSKGRDNAVIIGSDTMIECDGEKIGKPKNTEDANTILKKLQGRKHVIWTGVFMIDTAGQAEQGVVEKVEVTLYPMTDMDIKHYIQTGEPLDKAGAYAIQGIGGKFIQNLTGDRLAAIGLPLVPVQSFLKSRHIL